MLRIVMTILVPLIILFAGLSAAYMWAVPLFVGSCAVFLVILWQDMHEQGII